MTDRLRETQVENAAAGVTPVKVPDTAVCSECGYMLKGLPEPLCPECGRGFLPGDPSTFHDPALPGSIWRWWATPPPTWLLIAVTLITATHIYWSGHPGGVFCSFGIAVLLIAPFGVLLSIGLAADYVARILAIRADRGRASADKARNTEGQWFRWMILPVCTALVVSTFWSPWTLQCRFALSRPAFDAVRERIQNGADPWSLIGRIGLYDVVTIRVERTGDIDFFLTKGWDDATGFTYSPSDGPPSYPRKYPKKGLWVCGYTLPEIYSIRLASNWATFWYWE